MRQFLIVAWEDKDAAEKGVTISKSEKHTVDGSIANNDSLSRPSS